MTHLYVYAQTVAAVFFPPSQLKTTTNHKERHPYYIYMKRRNREKCVLLFTVCEVVMRTCTTTTPQPQKLPLSLGDTSLTALAKTRQYL